MDGEAGRTDGVQQGPGARRSTTPQGDRRSRLHRALLGLPRAAIVAIGVLAILAVTAADFLTDPGLRFYLFYWPAIAFVAWYAGRRWGWLAVALSSLGSGIANGAEWAALRPLTLLWNIAINVASFALVALLMSALRDLIERERNLARTDFLTALPNTRAFYEALTAELARGRRSRAALSLAYLDLDDFKQVNDRFGHGAGDAALRDIARTLRENLRESDIVARLGGDEFAILLPETGSAEAEALLGRLQERLLDLMVFRRWRITFSVGVVTCPAGAGASDEVIRTADDLMYRAKEGGKNALRGAVMRGTVESGERPNGN